MALERGASSDFSKPEVEQLHSSRSLTASRRLPSDAVVSGETPLAAQHSARRHLQAHGEHTLTIGNTAVEAQLSLLDEVHPEHQIFLRYLHVAAHVPSQAPVGGSLIIPGLPDMKLPKLSLPGFLNKRKEKQGDMEKGPAPSPSGTRQILFDICGCCRPGEVLAFMGPSGSGKTTLLSIIGARAQKAMTRSGEVTFNRQPLNKRMKRQIGYVMQDDLLYEALTVHETLYYAAMLRLPRTMSAAEKEQRVTTVINALGLKPCRDTIVGGFFRRGISGGERKRASIGHELLINPSLLLLDEPTSGLDSTTAMHLLTTLRELAKGGRAVVTTIHQPSSRLFQQLDKLLLLSKGHALYYGQAAHVDAWFAKLGFTLPYKINVADFILDIASGDVSTESKNGEECREYLIHICEDYLPDNMVDGYSEDLSDKELLRLRDSFRGKSARSLGMTGGDGLTLANGHGNRHAHGRKQDLEELAPNERTAMEVQGEKMSKASRWGAAYPEQIRILFIRSVRVRRFETLSTQDFFMFVTIAVLAGLFWLQRAQRSTITAAGDTLGLLFFELLFLSFRQLFVALFTFADVYKMLLKERASGMYRLSAFYIARTASDLPMDLALPTGFLLIVYFMAGLRYSASAFFSNYFTVLLVMLVAQSFGLLLGSISMNPKTAQTIAAVLMLTMVLTAGYFVRGIPVWIRWLRYGSFVFYGLGLVTRIEFDGRTLFQCTQPGPSGTPTSYDAPHPASNPACIPVPPSAISQTLGLTQNIDSYLWQVLNPVLLIAMLVALRFAVYVVLRHKTASI